jgi:outer membrane protein TolC
MRSTGEGNQLDLDAAALDLGAAGVDAANARGDLDVTRVRLARLLGRRDGATIVVSDDVDHAPVSATTAVDDLVARDPRVRAAIAELDAARATAEAERIAGRPEITLGLDIARARHDVPRGTFAGIPSLAGAWNEWEVAVELSAPLPLIDRNRVGRAGARAEVIAAAARLARVRADVRTNVAEAQAHLAAAIDAVDAAAEVPQIIERELQLLDKALHSGGLDLATWAQQAHRLAEVGRTYDDAILALRRARAAWARFDFR